MSLKIYNVCEWLYTKQLENIKGIFKTHKYKQKTYNEHGNKNQKLTILQNTTQNKKNQATLTPIKNQD